MPGQAGQHAARLPLDLPFDFKRQQLGGDGRGGKAQIAQKLVFGNGTWPKPVENDLVQRDGGAARLGR